MQSSKIYILFVYRYLKRQSTSTKLLLVKSDSQFNWHPTRWPSNVTKLSISSLVKLDGVGLRGFACCPSGQGTDLGVFRRGSGGFTNRGWDAPSTSHLVPSDLDCPTVSAIFTSWVDSRLSFVTLCGLLLSFPVDWWPCSDYTNN